MTIDYKKLMSRKSDEDLDIYVKDAEKYKPAAVWAAINELKSRGVTFAKEELDNIESILTARERERIEDEAPTGAAEYELNLVNDPVAPLLYSQRSIWLFSIAFSTIFGAVLLAMNLQSRTRKVVVISFGILFTIVMGLFFISPQIHAMIGGCTGMFWVNMVGAGILGWFWNAYIGRKTKYRQKSIIKPLIISAIIVLPFLVAIFYHS